jgi:hypothetical protein
MRKVYKQLTADQKARGVIFSSQLQPSEGRGLHEVLATDTDKEQVIARLLDDKFFNNSPYKFNEVRQ